MSNSGLPAFNGSVSILTPQGPCPLAARRGWFGGLLGGNSPVRGGLHGSYWLPVDVPVSVFVAAGTEGFGDGDVHVHGHVHGVGATTESVPAMGPGCSTALSQDG